MPSSRPASEAPVNEQEGNGTAQPEDTGRPDGAGQVEAAERAGAGGDGDAITALATRIAELEDQRLRALADLDNERKRCAVQVRRAVIASPSPPAPARSAASTCPAPSGRPVSSGCAVPLPSCSF